MSKNPPKSRLQPGSAPRQNRRLSHIVFGRTIVVFLCLLLQFFLLFFILIQVLQDLPVLFGSIVTFTAAMLLYVLNADDNPSIKLNWCIIIAILPVFGALIYFLVRIDLGHRVEQRLIARTIQESRQYIPENAELLARIAQQDRHLYQFSQYLSKTGSGRIYENTQVEYFPLGEDMFHQMLTQLETAEHFIFLEYFFIADSFMWDSILKILTRKAAEGVEVRVMYDGSCTISYLPPNYPQKLEKLGIRCKVFSPFRPLVSTHYNNRDHRKILVIDNRIAFTGGVNLLDRYINRQQVYGHWKDTAIMLSGEAARAFTLMFLQMWNATEEFPLYGPYLQITPPKVPSDGCVIPYGDSPLDKERVGKMVYMGILNQANDYVYIMTPYLILDYEMQTALRFAAMRGVDVRLILPHIPDKKSAFVLAKTHYAALTEAGVKIYEYTPGFIHAKVFLCDDREAVVGTINLDYRSLYLHFECAAYLYKVAAISQIKQDFEDTFSKSQLVTREAIRSQSLTTRIVGAVLKMIAPLM